MLKFFLAVLCITAPYLASLSFGELFLSRLYEKWKKDGGCTKDTFGKFLYQVLIEKKLYKYRDL
jgi:hypothetical protein